MGNKGNTLVVSLIGLGMLVILGLGIGNLSTSILKGKRRVDASLAFESHAKAFIQGVAADVSALAKDACHYGSNANFVLQFPSFSFPGQGVAKINQTQIDDWRKNATVIAEAPSALKTSLDQCFDSSPRAPASTAAPAGYTFCLVFTKEPTSSTESLLFNSDIAFAQIRVNLGDITQTPSLYTGPFWSCDRFRTDGNAGMSFFYRVFWHQPGETEGYYENSGTALIPKI